MNPIRNKKNLENITELLRNLSHIYLEKYNPSKQQLRVYLLKKMLQHNHSFSNKKEILYLIDYVISTLEKQKVLDDKLYSKIKARSYLRRGYSINKIKNRLFHKGVDKNYVDDTIQDIKDNQSDVDFFSAMKICKKRRIGPMRDENNRSLFYKKDIGILARSGFNYETSKKVLNLEKKEFIKFCKLI